MHESVHYKETPVTDDITSLVARVCHKIPPLWDLRNFVAVNPFIGFMHKPIAHAAHEIAGSLDAQLLPSLEFYRKKWQEGAFNALQLAAASYRMGHDPNEMEAIITGNLSIPKRLPATVHTFAERYDTVHNSNLHIVIQKSIARWCSMVAANGTAIWPLRNGFAAKDCEGLYASWREIAGVERLLEIAGLKGWRNYAKQLPATADEAIEQCLVQLGLPSVDVELYLYRLLGWVFGWASFYRLSSWAAKSDDHGLLRELLAICLCVDTAVAQRINHDSKIHALTPWAKVEDEAIRLTFQEALEDGYVGRVITQFKLPEKTLTTARPAVQAVFCIDVRSEVLRRHLEAQSDMIETIGFAGFFGVALGWKTGEETSARCPVLLHPSIEVCASHAPAKNTLSKPIKQLQSAPASAFSFVELLGIVYGSIMTKDAVAANTTLNPLEDTADFILHAPLNTKIEMAKFILNNMGLNSRFGRIVLLCGHESHSTNNPHAASLDCGACGGHSGGINARVAATLLNDPQVREELNNISSDTLFVAAVHNTSTDTLALLDTATLPKSHTHDIHQLEIWLTQASDCTRKERAKALDISTSAAIKPQMEKRARDWSEVRPEWGLARNAAFIAARRSRSRGVDLEGRTFLHDYDWQNDMDGSILTLILTAPMVVASWINLQYFASTVDNTVLGCGNKTLHNPIGSIGVVLGNSGDLRTGLAAQSVYAPDGSWYHEPLRLQVIVEAPIDHIEKVLGSQPEVWKMIKNGWVRLFALNPDNAQVYRCLSGRVWEPCLPLAAA